MSRRVAKVLRLFGIRVSRVEDAVEQQATAAARMADSAERIERAVVEQGRTLRDALERMTEESSRRGSDLKTQREDLRRQGRRILQLEKREGLPDAE